MPRYFYSLVYVGTPPQRQTVILDTGSSILAFPCSMYKLVNNWDDWVGVKIVASIRMLPSIHLSHRPYKYPFYSSIMCVGVPLHYPVGCSEVMYKGRCSSCQNNQCHFNQVSKQNEIFPCIHPLSCFIGYFNASINLSM